MFSTLSENQILQAAKERGASVCGLGISNLPLVDFLIKQGICVTVRDKKSREAFDAEILERLEKNNVKTVFGDSYLEDIGNCVIFRTPGIRPDGAGFEEAISKGAVMTSEMELFFELTRAHLFGITGSDGKTTTTTLTYKFLDEQTKENGVGRRVYVGGNIGEPLLPKVESMTQDDYAVVELSSFQLMTMRNSPEHAVITNITPNHLNWHKDMEEYKRAKENICTHKGIKRLTVNKENATTADIGSASDVEEVFFFSSRAGSYCDIVSERRKGIYAVYINDGRIVVSDGENEDDILGLSDIILPGRHNIENYMAAIAQTYGIVDKRIYANVASTFKGVEHRLELVRELDGVRYYNSSIDSSPTRTAAALSALPEKPVVICGGYDKNIPFGELATALINRSVGVVLTGATALKIKAALDECPDYDKDRLPVSVVDDFDEAVYTAREMTHGKGIVILSPACASFDRFKNFEERGKYFKDIVRRMR